MRRSERGLCHWRAWSSHGTEAFTVKYMQSIPRSFEPNKATQYPNDGGGVLRSYLKEKIKHSHQLVKEGAVRRRRKMKSSVFMGERCPCDNQSDR